MGDPEAVEALERLEREAMEVEEEAEEKGFSGAEYAAYAYLHDDCGVDEHEARRVAETLCDALTEQVNTSYPGWWRNKNALRSIKKVIYKTLAQADTPEDLDVMTVGSELRDYLIANHVDDTNR
jgi:type I restriction enzyme R subunit